MMERGAARKCLGLEPAGRGLMMAPMRLTQQEHGKQQQKMKKNNLS